MPKLLKILTFVTVAAFVAMTVLVFAWTPVERSMGLVQKVFYYHMSAAWIGMLGFVVTAVSGVLYLVTRKLKWDIIGLAGVEVGMVFMLIAIVSGMIWAYPVWGTWWTWEPRLTTAAIMEMAYVAYLMLRRGIEEPERRARFSAVYSLVAVLTVPITFLSIRLFRTIHPVIIASGGSGAQNEMSMSPDMVVTLVGSVLVFTLVFVCVMWHRIRLGYLASELEQKRLKMMG
jgi:heme exporter protein C